ncbi:MAG: hypothetical protein AAB403_06460 [Planctomycetota bacterium]
MEFTGAQLAAILRDQWSNCLVRVRREAAPDGAVEPALAAKLVAEGDYIGVGHYKRIIYLKPRNVGLWRGRRTTERAKNDAGVFIGAPQTTIKHIGNR